MVFDVKVTKLCHKHLVHTISLGLKLESGLG